MKRAFLKRRAKSTLLVVIFVVAACFGVLSLHPLAKADPADSITVSPNYNSMTAFRESSGTDFHTDSNSAEKVQTIAHVIKSEPSSTILALKTAAYFSTPSQPVEFAITHIGAPDRCRVYDPRNSYNRKGFVRVTYSYVTNDDVTHTFTNDIDKNGVCKIDRTGPGLYNLDGYSATNRLFTNYKIPTDSPAGFANAKRDIDTGMYKVDIQVAYDSGIRQGSTTQQQQISFRMKLDDCQAADGPSCLRYLSTRPASNGPNDGTTTDRNYSTLRGNTNDGAIATTQRFSFGLPCSINAVQTKTISVYDVDNDTFYRSNGFRAGFYVQKFVVASNAWVNASYNDRNTGEIRNIMTIGSDGVARSDPSLWKRDTNTYNGAPGIFGVQPDGRSGVSTSVTIVMQPQTRYRLVIQPVKTTNLLGIGLPTETIFGDLNCNIVLNGRIDSTPATDPIEPGRTVDLVARASRSGNTALTSQYDYTFRTWYDTGNEIYDGGETEVCPLRTGSKSQTGDDPAELARCDNALSDTSKSGGKATAICALLTLTATETITTVGTGAAPTGVKHCIQIGKRPHLAALNGDVFAGGAISTPCEVTPAAIVSGNKVSIDGANYGSYSTYGVTSLGLLQDFGSNSQKPDDPFSDTLLFSNRKIASKPYGYFYNTNATYPTTGRLDDTRCINEAFDIVGPKATTPGGSVTDVDLSTLVSPGNLRVGRYYTTSGTLNVTASGPIPAGARIVIRADRANILVASDIKYEEGPYVSTEAIPQVSLLSADRNIVIKDTVTQVDGLILAKGDVITCDKAPRLNVCEKPLAINGAVVAGGLVRPYRTYGAEKPDYGSVAETFSIRPDFLVSDQPSPTNTDVFMRTANEVEAPPRF